MPQNYNYIKGLNHVKKYNFPFSRLDEYQLLYFCISLQWFYAIHRYE